MDTTLKMVVRYDHTYYSNILRHIVLSTYLGPLVWQEQTLFPSYNMRTKEEFAG